MFLENIAGKIVTMFLKSFPTIWKGVNGEEKNIVQVWSSNIIDFLSINREV